MVLGLYTIRIGLSLQSPSVGTIDCFMLLMRAVELLAIDASCSDSEGRNLSFFIPGAEIDCLDLFLFSSTRIGGSETMLDAAHCSTSLRRKRIVLCLLDSWHSAGLVFWIKSEGVLGCMTRAATALLGRFTDPICLFTLAPTCSELGSKLAQRNLGLLVICALINYKGRGKNNYTTGIFIPRFVVKCLSP